MNCSSDLKMSANSWPSSSNLNSFSQSLEQFFHTLSQNNRCNKIPCLFFSCRFLNSKKKTIWKKNTIYLFLIFQGQQIAAENPEIQHDMMEAVQAVQATGEEMSSAAKDFAADPCSSVKRGNMVRIFFIS